MTLFMLPRRFVLRNGRTLEIRMRFRGPFVLTLEGQEIATIERRAMNEWNSVQLYDGTCLQLRAVRDRGALHFDVVHDQQTLPGSVYTIDWRMHALALMLAADGCIKVVAGVAVNWRLLHTEWDLSSLAIGATLFLVAAAVRQRSRIAVWAALLWFAWVIGQYQYEQLSRNVLGIEFIPIAGLYYAWKSLDALKDERVREQMRGTKPVLTPLS